MGQVYLASTPSGRQLVVKMIRPELAAEDGFRARFAREADAAHRVGGFHTAQVVDADPDAESPWIATAHIPGLTLEQTVRRSGPITPSPLHSLATGLAEGLDAIHACGLVHRDLKPANIILAEDGPRIIDFGIARPLDADSLTTQGTVFGTLPYMSPEQTDGSRLGSASDVFSLGTVLAYAATGTSPFTGATMAETLRRLISPPPDPGEVTPDVRELIADCWNHDPALRPTPGQILARFEGLDLHGSSPASHASGASRAEPGSDPPPASETPDAARSQPPDASPDDAETERKATLRRTEVQPRRDTVEAEDSPQPRSPERKPRGPSPWKLSRRQQTGIFAGAAAVALIGVLLFVRDTDEPEPPAEPSEATTFTGHIDSAWSVAFGSDGATLATGSRDGTARLWNTDTGETITTFETDDENIWVRSVALSPDGATLATGSDDNTVRLWDADTGETTATFEGQDDPWSVAFSPDGATLATGNIDGTARLLDADTGETITTFEGHNTTVRSVAFSPDGATLATGSGDIARLWDTDTGETTATFEGHDDDPWASESVNSVAFSPDGAILATGSADNTARLWDTDTGESITTLEGHEDTVRSVAFSPDGAVLATGSDDETARLWNTDTGETITTLEGHEDTVRSVAFSPDGATLATGSADNTARLWDID